MMKLSSLFAPLILVFGLLLLTPLPASAQEKIDAEAAQADLAAGLG